MSEFIQSAGLEIALSDETHSQGESWTTTVPAGLWCGALAQGALATLSGGEDRREWFGSAETALCSFWIEEPRQNEHVPLRTGPLSAAFVRILPDAVEETVGPEGLAMTAPAPRSLAGRLPNAIGHALSWQMLGCPLTGTARKLYLTGKAMELVSVVLQAAADQPQTSDAGLGRSHDIKRLYDARAILLENLENPPAVPELARIVGLNARKLGIGFKALFGASVYAFVKTQRLEQAHLLLENGDVTVAQAAYACGYQPSHFSTEFRRRFGIPPSALTAARKTPL
ncbi:AraC family transcriptional regulator [Methyloligella sp. 2.7D]|uniref:helix-turn-helix domain-containing protein n=1 Tax=unclassified Methyloligella TaxID=2625955 RepID=UPI00157CE0DC|nr:AraC family transcriptional regulator [Methyloligella sp. GL2]QKP76968.1 helix-turn-helix transcriptional regulator [Methyloligella sp. GL2]